MNFAPTEIGAKTMIYFRSALAGIAALTFAGTAVSAFAMLTLREAKNKFSDPPYFIEWHLYPWSILGGALLAFAVDFIWQFNWMSGSSRR